MIYKVILKSGKEHIISEEMYKMFCDAMLEPNRYPELTAKLALVKTLDFYEDLPSDHHYQEFKKLQGKMTLKTKKPLDPKSRKR